MIFFWISSARWGLGGGGVVGAEGYKIAGKDLLLVDSSDLRVFAT